MATLEKECIHHAHMRSLCEHDLDMRYRMEQRSAFCTTFPLFAQEVL
jgi:hypothetical protein